MVFLLRKKATATAHKAKEQELATKLQQQQQQPAKVVTGEALSAMSIQYDNSRMQQTPTYQQPGNASIVAPAAAKISSRPQPVEYQQPIDEQLSSSATDIYKQPYGSYLTAGSSTAGSIAREGSTSTVRPVPSSSPVPPSPSTSGLMVKGAALPPLYEDRITQASTSASPSPSGYYASSYGQYRSPQLESNQGQGHHRTDSASSASSYAASDTSDVLHNSVGTRSSSGGTTATTPGSHCAKDGYVSVERKLSLASTRLQQPPLPSTVERVPVPTMTAVIKPRPESQISNTGSVTSVPSPALSQTSSFVRKTASRYTLTDFAFQRTLGTGSFGRVHLVRSCHNLRFYAVKVLNKERVVRMKQVEHTNSEREMLERARHPFLVNLWGTFKDSQNLYMVMDFVSGGELFSLLRKSQRFPDAVAKFFAAEVALALDYLHSLDIIYRDLKPENILLAADGHIKITDFGFAKYVPDITWTLCGTPDYLAPEIVQSKGYNKSVDWYALGVLIFEMLAGYPPFFTEDSNPMRLYEKIIAGKVRYPSYFTEDAKDLLRSLLTGDLSKRFGNLANGSRDIFGHSYFAEVDWNRLYRKEIPAPYVPRVDSDGDSSNFDNYAEIDVKEYGQTGADPHGHLFTSF